MALFRFISMALAACVACVMGIRPDHEALLQSEKETKEITKLPGIGEPCTKSRFKADCDKSSGKEVACDTIRLQNNYRCCIKAGEKERNLPLDGNPDTCCSGQTSKYEGKDYCF